MTIRETKGNNEDKTYSLKCKFVINATGQLNEPLMPDFMKDYQKNSSANTTNKGHDFQWCHTARWLPSMEELKGKTVAVVGNGSSGVQTVQAITPVVKHLYLFARTPKWLIPKLISN